VALAPAALKRDGIVAENAGETGAVFSSSFFLIFDLVVLL
jgi:hypothetical protein